MRICNLPLSSLLGAFALSLSALSACSNAPATADLTPAPADLARSADLAAPPDLAVPDLATPDLSMPDLLPPDLSMPDLAAPDLSMPDLRPPPDLSPSCTDGVKNGTETDVDCGGSTCAPCKDGQGCTVPGDCGSGQCTANKCAWDYLWTYNEGAGTIAHDSGPRAADGTLAGTISWTAGTLGGALRFAKGRVEAPGTIFACPALTEMTAMAWINYGGPQPDDWQAIFVKAGLWELGILDDTEQLCFWRQAAGSVLCTPFTGAQYKGKWTHVAVTINAAADQIRLFINGAQVAAGKFGVAKLDCGAGTLYHGVWDPSLAGSPEYFIGDMDQLRLSLRALAPADVLRVYQTDTR